jgi:hypothetical protein
MYVPTRNVTEASGWFKTLIILNRCTVQAFGKLHSSEATFLGIKSLSRIPIIFKTMGGLYGRCGGGVENKGSYSFHKSKTSLPQVTLLAAGSWM